MLYQDYNASIRDIFKQVEGVSQHGLEQLYDDDVREGKRSYAQAIIDEGLASREDVLSLVAQFLGYELQIGEVAEIEEEALRLRRVGEEEIPIVRVRETRARP